MPGAPLFDFSRYESAHPALFQQLRRAGWYPERFVEFVRAETRPGLEYAFVLDDYPQAFLHSFYGLETSVKTSWGERGFSIGFGKNLDRLHLEENIPYLNGFTADNDLGTFPYPVLEWSTFVGFVTDLGAAVAINETFQTYVRAQNPYQLMDFILFGQDKPGVQTGYLERKHMPLDFWHLVWNRPLEYHLPNHRAVRILEGNQTRYVLEYTGYQKHENLFKIHVSQLEEANGELFASYKRADQSMSTSLATDLIVFKLLDEFFEGSYRSRIRLMHLTDERTGEVTTLTWPKAAFPAT